MAEFYEIGTYIFASPDDGQGERDAIAYAESISLTPQMAKIARDNGMIVIIAKKRLTIYCQEARVHV